MTAAHFRKSPGNFVKIAHNSTYSTSYYHLSKFARGIRKGKSVKQGDIIGYVGSTGMATGPHLHFAFYENGRFVDPLGLKFPAADPIKAEERESFLEAAEESLALLPNWAPSHKTIGGVSPADKPVSMHIRPR